MPQITLLCIRLDKISSRCPQMSLGYDCLARNSRFCLLRARQPARIDAGDQWRGVRGAGRRDNRRRHSKAEERANGRKLVLDMSEPDYPWPTSTDCNCNCRASFRRALKAGERGRTLGIYYLKVRADWRVVLCSLVCKEQAVIVLTER